MKAKCYAVFDKAVEAFMPPFYSRADGEAVRSFVEACKDKGRFAPHLGDYTLFAVGTFDDSSGLFDCEGFPKRLMYGLEAANVEGNA